MRHPWDNVGGSLGVPAFIYSQTSPYGHHHNLWPPLYYGQSTSAPRTPLHDGHLGLSLLVSIIIRRFHCTYLVKKKYNKRCAQCVTGSICMINQCTPTASAASAGFNTKAFVIILY